MYHLGGRQERRRLGHWLGRLAFAASLVSGCGSEAPSPPPGPPPEPAPARIVVLSPDIAEILVELGVASQVVAADAASRRLPELSGSEALGDLCEVRVDVVAAFDPDLALVLASPCGLSLARGLERDGMEVLAFGSRGLDDAVAAWDRLGVRLGRELRARMAVARLTRDVSRIATARDGRHRLRVVWLLERDPLVVVGARGVLHEMLELAGGENAFHTPPTERLEVTAAEIAARAPDRVLDGSEDHGVELSLPASLTIERIEPELSRVPVLAVLGRIRRLHALLYPEDAHPAATKGASGGAR